LAQLLVNLKAISTCLADSDLIHMQSLLWEYPCMQVYFTVSWNLGHLHNHMGDVLDSLWFGPKNWTRDFNLGVNMGYLSLFILLLLLFGYLHSHKGDECNFCWFLWILSLAYPNLGLNDFVVVDMVYVMWVSILAMFLLGC
jgi:hypothetical protein